MTRLARLDAAGALHHIMVLEINKSATGRIFMSAAEITCHLGVATSSITRAIEKMVEGTW